MSAISSLAEILQGVQSEIERLDSVGPTVEAALGRLDERIANLQSTDSSVVRKELQRILADEKLPEHNVLKKLVVLGKPQHKNTPLLLAALQARVPVWLFGDAGSGKTTSAARAAEMLDLPFRFISVCPTTTKSELMGYRDANGSMELFWRSR